MTQVTSTYDPTSIIIDLTITLVVLAIPLTLLAIFWRLGGYPEGYYRMLRIQRFVWFVLDTDGNPVRHVIKASKIVTKSPPSFTDYFHDPPKTRYIDRANLTRSKGAPSHYYKPDNALPIPMNTGDRDVILDPIRINRYLRSDLVTRLFRIGQEKKPRRRWGLIALALLLILGGLFALGYLLR